MKKATTTMKKTKTGSKEGKGGDCPSQLIDARIKELSDWRGETLARVRTLIKQADPEVVEELKWVKPTNPGGVPVWSHAGMICTGETYKNVVKMTFAKGASLEDPSGLFNSSLEGNTRRAIDFHEGDKIDEKALKALIRAAAALNTSSAGKRPGTSACAAGARRAGRRATCASARPAGSRSRSRSRWRGRSAGTCTPNREFRDERHLREHGRRGAANARRRGRGQRDERRGRDPGN